MSQQNRAEGPRMTTIRLTMAQALIRYLAAQTSEIDGREIPLFAGVFAIFGHGNVAGIGQALAEMGNRLPTYRAHNEQGMALAAIAFAKASNRRRSRPCQPPAAPDAAGRCLCRPPARSRPAADRELRRPDPLRQ